MKYILLKSFRILVMVALATQCLYSQSGKPTIKDEFNLGSAQKTGDGLDATSSSEATQYFEELAYSKAIDTYLKKEDKLTEGDQLRLAQSLYKADRKKEAIVWFKKVITENSDPENILQYAQALQESGQLQEAKDMYATYASKLRNGNENKSNYVFNGNVVNESRFGQHDVKLYNESKINTEHLEFSPAFMNDQIVYVTTNPAVADGTELDPWINENFMGLQKSAINREGYLTGAENFSDIISTPYHEGPLAFSKDGNELFFTRNSYQDNKKDLSSDKVLKLKIFHTSKISNKWSTPKPVNFSTADNQEAHPTLSQDGNTMIFASDRKGTNGQMDLFVSTRDGSSWSSPQNLGTTINTIGNELFPYLAADGMLYFASDTHDGLGGLDIFVSQKMSNGNWSTPKNLGTPFNSTSDDFGYIIDGQMKKGYLTSARPGGFGKDDIYGFTLPANPYDDQEVVICTVDSLTREALTSSELDISILDTEDRESEITETLEDGCIRMKVDPNKTYRIFASKDGFHTSEGVFSKAKHGNKWNVSLYKPGCVYLTGTVTNEIAGSAIEGAEVILTNLNTNKTRVLKTDLQGKFTQCLPCGADYDIGATKNGFNPGMAMISTEGTDCSTEALLTTQIPLGLKTNEDATFAVNELAIGQVVILENIYYDFDESYIKDEEQVDLDRLVNTMHQYPGLVIELGAHTDARGTSTYNQNLSERRAQSAMAYLTDRGISPSRIIPIGYGESQIRNQCYDGVKCLEDEHLYNRRTEIRILENSTENVTVQYQDNLPSSYTYIDDKVRYTGTQNTISSDFGNNAYSPNQETFESNPDFGTSVPSGVGSFCVITGSYDNYENAQKKVIKLMNLGYESASINESNEMGKYQVRAVSGLDRYTADELAASLRLQGIETFVKEENGY